MNRVLRLATYSNGFSTMHYEAVGKERVGVILFSESEQSEFRARNPFSDLDSLLICHETNQARFFLSSEIETGILL